MIVLRRFLSALFNGIILLTILLSTQLALASILFVVGKTGDYDVFVYVAVFSVCYSLLGALGIGFLPSLGSKIAGISVVAHNTSVSLCVRKLVRQLAYMVLVSAPLASIFVNHIIPGEQYSHFRISASIVAIISLAFVTPVSIMISRGKSSLHDYIAGTRISRHGVEHDGEYFWNFKLFFCTVAASLCVGLLLFTVYQGLAVKAIGIDMVEYFRRVGLAYKATGVVVDYKKYIGTSDFEIPEEILYVQANDGLLWYADINKDPDFRRKIVKLIGCNSLRDDALSGFGVKVFQPRHDKSLESFDRDSRIVLGKADIACTVYANVSSSVAYDCYKSKRVRDFVVNKLIPSATLQKIYESGVLRIKTLCYTRVGVVTAGYCDDRYITRDNRQWRSEYTFLVPPFILNLIYDSSATGNAPVFLKHDQW